MKIISWNLNSIRARLDHLIEILEIERPDFICLQETKVINESFPEEEIKKKKYFVIKNGMASYNGVAILSKHKPKKVEVHNFCNKPDCRHIVMTYKSLKIHSIYVPAGGDEPNPKINSKFEHKLQFLDEMKNFFKPNRNFSTIVCGDFNVAPYEDDVWSHKSLVNVVSHTNIEREKVLSVLNECKFQDAIRFFISPPDNVYTWWSYRSPDFTTNNRGRRLDHIWVSDDKKIKLLKAKILVDFRKRAKPSDHVPLSLEFNL